MSKPRVVLDPHWRRLDELFSVSARQELASMCEIVWARDDRMPDAEFNAAVTDAAFIIQAMPTLSAADLDKAKQLKAIIEVSGAFPDTVDYSACHARGVEVLCCAPGFRQSVAEMALAMVLGSGRGLVAEHENFREGRENWLKDMEQRDVTLFGARVGFIGYGQIARETARVMAPFGVDIHAYDPWLQARGAEIDGVSFQPLDAVLSTCQIVFVTASPTRENRAMIGQAELARLQTGSLLVLISRAHLVDFEALTHEIVSGRLRAAIDVFPEEPLAADHPLRQADGVILSPHRAAAVSGGRRLIGDLIVSDIRDMIAGKVPSALQRAANMPVDSLSGVGDAEKVGKLIS